MTGERALIRHKQRHIHRTLVDMVRGVLVDGGWVNPPVIFGATSVTIVDVQPEERGLDVAVNTVAITMGDEGPQDDEELGASSGGLVSVQIPVFIDIYGEQQAISTAIASDIKDAFTNRTITLLDWSQNPPTPVDGVQIELTDVAGPERPQAAVGITGFKRHWRVVKAMTTTYYLS